MPEPGLHAGARDGGTFAPRRQTTKRNRSMSDGTHDPNTLSLPFVEALYAEYLRDPSAVSPGWRRYFDDLGETNGFSARPALGPSFRAAGLYGRSPLASGNGSRANALIASADLEPSFVARPAPGEAERG